MPYKDKKLIIESKFIKEALKNNLSLTEFLLLCYFDNSFDLTFNVESIKDVLKMSEEEILEAYSLLLSKKLIKVDVVKNEAGKMSEKISLEPFYEGIIMQDKKQQAKQAKEDIFSIFEEEFGRTLSGSDYELINAWMEKNFSEDIIIAALKEASYNGSRSLKYIDKILYEWRKKGINKPEDLNKVWQENEEDIPTFETKVLNFDWLNESK